MITKRAMLLQKIISGGQTGADRAALDAVMAAKFPIGGYCPKGRKAEDGVIAAKYSLIEIAGGYIKRTCENVVTTDGTVLFYNAILSGGTEKTMLFCI